MSQAGFGLEEHPHAVVLIKPPDSGDKGATALNEGEDMSQKAATKQVTGLHLLTAGRRLSPGNHNTGISR